MWLSDMRGLVVPRDRGSVKGHLVKQSPQSGRSLVYTVRDGRKAATWLEDISVPSLQWHLLLLQGAC